MDENEFKKKRRRIDCSGKIDYEILYYYSLYMFIQNKNKNVAYVHKFH